MTGTLRSCAAGGGHHLAYVSKSFGGRYFCPKHHQDLFAGFDPQPRDRVRLIDHAGYLVEPEFIVVERFGDEVTMQQLGFPERPRVEARVGSLWPGAGVHINWRRGCGARTPEKAGAQS